jgi:thiol-disulfide isomerase/thioredoxin
MRTCQWAMRALGLGTLPLLLLTLSLAAHGADEPALTLQDVHQRPLLWPAEVATTTPLSDGRRELPAGTEVEFHGFHEGGVLVQFPGDDGLVLLEPDMTDVIGRANAAAASLPEEARNLTLADLVTRADLLPPVVTLVEDVDFPDRTRSAGSVIGSYRVVRLPDGSYALAALDPQLAQAGVFHQRQSYPFEQTDFVQKLRERMITDAAEPTPGLIQQLAGKLVDADGNAVELAEGVRFIAIYSGAGWCGFCKRLNPALATFYDEVKAAHPEVEAIYYGSDRSAAEMLDHMKSAGLGFPGVRHDARLDTPAVLGLISGATPQLLIVHADGRILHDGSPAGEPGARAAMAALRAELAKSTP